MLAEQEQRLLPAHAPADRVNPPEVDPEPREIPPHDVGHARQVCDLPTPPPRPQLQPSAHAARADDGEIAVRREIAPPLRVVRGRNATTVRGDHERQRRRWALRSVSGRDVDDRGPPATVGGPVAKVPVLDPISHQRQAPPTVPAR